MNVFLLFSLDLFYIVLSRSADFPFSIDLRLSSFHFSRYFLISKFMFIPFKSLHFLIIICILVQANKPTLFYQLDNRRPFCVLGCFRLFYDFPYNRHFILSCYFYDVSLQKDKIISFDENRFNSMFGHFDGNNKLPNIIHKMFQKKLR